MNDVRLIVISLIALCAPVLRTERGHATEPPRRVWSENYESKSWHLRIEVLDDDLVLFEYAPAGAKVSERIELTPMVAKRDYSGPSRVSTAADGTVKTAEFELRIEPASLRMTLLDARTNPSKLLSALTPVEGTHPSFTLAAGSMTHAYGLGEQFVELGQPNGDWVGRVRTPGCEFGNRMVPFGGGAVGNAMFPILYALGGPGENYAIFFDDVHAQTWDLTKDPWTVQSTGNTIRGYFLTGPDLPDLRRDYMELVGRPPVPPKKTFGLWVSEYGFDDWAELKDKLATLREHRFPVDGLIMDLQWFGGIVFEKPESRMGSLTWDTKRFPAPRRTIQRLAEKDGVGLVLIEESYVSRGQPAFRRMEKAGYVARDDDGSATVLRSWWGEGGMIDWTNRVGADDWHDKKRQPLVDMGIQGHWTDLGEPEDYDAKSVYAGLDATGSSPHREVHNLLNFRWLESIQRGYARNSPEKRPFTMSRSGISGVQRFGASMWSGDIGSNVGSLATHLNAQMHMSLSGVDYFGSDVGGFKRKALDGDENELYTMWLANACAFDVPVRPHTANTTNRYQTAPDRIGDRESNLANLRRRYELIPYLYSLAHRAYEFGEPLVPPLVYYFQDDPQVREIGDVKLIGRDLLVAAAYQYGAKSRDVYLPAGVWYDYHTGVRIESDGQWIRDVPLQCDGRLTLPMFARAGAIIPLMYVDDQTMNAIGQRRDGTRRNELIVRVFAGDDATEFTLYEDDGTTTAYQRGKVRKTKIRQRISGPMIDVIIEPSEGDFEGAPARRPIEVRLVTDGKHPARGASLNVAMLPRDEAGKADPLAPGWRQVDSRTVAARSGALEVRHEKVFEFEFGR
ncbi:MAG TPA: TIM-barrel domain-containing protein [Phycisphaerae bacterium]|nr:TIM-barrel domain-containing protein [Phycisphaerae bacterium]